MSDFAASSEPHRTRVRQRLVDSPIFSTVCRPITDLLVIVSLYFLFAGHHRPGGGFVGGLVASAAFALQLLTAFNPLHSSPWRIGPAMARHPEIILGLGLFLAATTTAVALMLTGNPLDHVAYELVIPAIGAVTLSTTLVFDTGVYFVVIGLVTTMLHEYGTHLVAETSPHL